jgi:hypothetical protein
LLLAPQRGMPFDGSVQFSGSLEVVTHHTVSILLSDGRIVDARIPDAGELSAQSLFGKYRMGDLVEIKGLPMEPVRTDRDTVFPFRDEETGLARNLDLEQIRFLRKPSAAELAIALQSGAVKIKQNLLATPGQNDEEPNVSLKTLRLPDSSDLPAPKNEFETKLEHTRLLVHQYLSALPNRTADEVLTTSESALSATPKWRVTETLQAEVNFQGSRETLRNIVRNGVKWPDTAILPNGHRASASTSRLGQIFNEDCPITINFEKRAVEAGTPVLVYHFASPRDSCFGANTDGGYQRYFAGHTGEVFVGEADGLVREIDSTTTGFPAEFGHRTTEERVTWDQVKIGEERHLLPVSAERLLVAKSVMALSVVKYTNHRHFESTSKITFH